MPIGSGIVYNTGDLILSQVSSSGTAFLETKIAAATSSLIYFDSTARINSASLNSITVGTSSYVSGSTSIITNLTASNISASGTGSFGIVGIGTVNPAYKLDVNGNANFTNGFYTNTDASSTSYFVGANGTRPIIFQNNTATSYDFGFKFTDSNTFTIVGGNTLANPTTDLVSFTYDGKVGIGTTGPADKLSVISGSTRIASTALAGALYFGNDTSNIYLQRDNSYDLSLVQNGDSNSALYLASAGNVYVNIDSNNNDTDKAFIVQNNAIKAGTELFRVQENGNVGVGTTSPAAKLHIYNGSSHFEATSNGNAAIVAGLYALQIGPLHDRDSTAGRYYGGIAFNHLLNFGGGTTYNGAPQAWIGTRLQDTTGSERDYLVFATKPGTGVSGTGNDIPLERMCIDRDGLVGIGTTSPTAKLQVGTQMYGSAPDANYFVVGNENFTGPGPIGGITGYPVTGNRNQVTASIFDVVGGWESINGSHALLRVSAYDVINSTPALTVLNSGYIGIGTTNPVARLQVAGNISGSSFTSSISNAVGFLGTSSWAQNVVSSSFATTAQTANALNPANSYTITNLTASNISASLTGSFGIVGIGTNSPTQKLHVVGTVFGTTNGQFGNAVITGTGAGFAVFGSNAGATGVKINLDSDITRNDLVISASTGYVGIGTSNPLERITFGSSDSIIARSSGTTFNSGYCSRILFNQGGTGYGYLGFYTYEGGSGGGERMRIAENGNVGIGTTIPNNKLDIWGGTGTTFNMANDSDSGRGGKLTFISSSATGRQFYVGTNSSIYNLVFGIDSIEKMRLDTSGYFAINTTNTTPYSSLFPGQLVVDAGTSNVDGIFSSTNNTNAAELILTKKNPTNNFGSLLIQHSGSSGDAIALNYNVNTSTGVGGTNSFKVTTDGTGYFRGNVGIGTTSPTGSLHVNKSSQTLGATTPSGATIISNLAGGNGILELGVDTTNLAYIQSRNITDQTYYKLLLNPSGGSVGIGTTSPNSKLEVAGTAGTAIVSVNNTSANRSGSFGIDSNGVFIRNSNNGDYFDLKNASGVARFRVIYDNATHLTTNFVSIGNLSATGSKLSVFGNLSVGSTYGSTAAPSNGAIFQGTVGVGTTSPDSAFHVYSTTWEPAIRITSTTGSVKTYGMIVSPYWATGSFHIYDYTTDNSRFQISTTGNVGIGVAATTPSNKLDLVGDLRVRSAGAAIILDTNASSDGRMEYKYNGTRKALIGVDSDNLQISADSGNYLQFRTNSTQRMIINNSGGVGIGTSSPNYLFDIYDTGANSAMMSLRSSGSGNARIYFDAANGDLIGSDYCYLGQDDSTLDFVINTATAAGNIHLQPKQGSNNGILYVSGSSRFGQVISQTHQFTGSVNISGSLNATASWAQNVVSASYALTSSFATRAQTANALNASNTYTVAGLTSAYVDVDGSSAPTTGIYRPSTKTLGLSADSTLIFKISNVSVPATSSIETGNFIVQSGNVGIGTANATDKLTVYGALASYKTGADTIQTQVYLANAGNTRAFNLQLNSGGTGLDLWSYNSSNAWQKHTTFNYDGNVGIGTAVPAAKLEITGSSNSALLNIKSPISGAILYVSGSGAVGIGDSNVGTYRLYVSGSFGATTKSFIIDHPTKAGKKLIYGSLESPYHGIRLTGRDTLKDGKCKVELPEYIYKLILHDSVNIQLTGIKCNKTLYVDEINIPENYFTIAYDKGVFESYKDYDFFWDFTAIRADVPELTTEL